MLSFSPERTTFLPYFVSFSVAWLAIHLEIFVVNITPHAKLISLASGSERGIKAYYYYYEYTPL